MKNPKMYCMQRDFFPENVLLGTTKKGRIHFRECIEERYSHIPLEEMYYFSDEYGYVIENPVNS